MSQWVGHCVTFKSCLKVWFLSQFKKKIKSGLCPCQPRQAMSAWSAQLAQAVQSALPALSTFLKLLAVTDLIHFWNQVLKLLAQSALFPLCLLSPLSSPSPLAHPQAFVYCFYPGAVDLGNLLHDFRRSWSRIVKSIAFLVRRLHLIFKGKSESGWTGSPFSPPSHTNDHRFDVRWWWWLWMMLMMIMMIVDDAGDEDWRSGLWWWDRPY